MRRYVSNYISPIRTTPTNYDGIPEFVNGGGADGCVDFDQHLTFILRYLEAREKWSGYLSRAGCWRIFGTE